MMRYALVLLVLGGAACTRKSSAASAPPAPAAAPALSSHLRAAGDERKATSPITVTVNGKPAGAWTAAQLDATPVLDLTNKNGEAREGWSLKDLASKLVSPKARVTAVVGQGGQKLDVDEKSWQDPSKFLVIKVSRKGDYKLHWAGRDGAADDAIVKGVQEIDLAQ